MDKYDANNDHYCYPNTNILKNKLNIKNEAILEEAEREITRIKVNSIKHFEPPYTIDYLKKIHHILFSELYDWAGEIRNVSISKGGTLFCLPNRIIPEITKLFKKLENENYLQNLSYKDFIKKLAEYYTEFNMIHPFREGNGRVQRLFFEHLAAYNGYTLNWEAISQNEWIQANIDGFHVNYQSLANIFEKILKIH